MKVFEKSKWIWIKEGEGPDQYADFRDTVCHSGKKTVINISADSDYTLYVNGKYAASGQYGDYEHYKIYDTIDITEFLSEGENRLDFIVYHCGADKSLRYCPYAAGLIYEVIEDGTVTAASSENTESRLSKVYESGKMVMITWQLGFTFFYDATKKDDEGYSTSVTVDKNCVFFPRPIKKQALLPKREMKSVTKLDDTHYIVDLGGEVVGLPHLDFASECKQKIKVYWGEHLLDGKVRWQIRYRNFTYEYTATEGHNIFTEYMLRIAGRYVEVVSEEPIELNYAGIIPQVYETKPLPYSLESELDEKIYKICLNTLECCMMEHYVDCPWREQALYAFDSRNQMLIGYSAYADKNAEYARANLKLIGQNRREEGILSLCHPCGMKLTIPAFSLYYILAVSEYTKNTGDVTLAREVMPKMREICDTFLKNRSGALVHKLAGEQMWNFYDWHALLDGHSENGDLSPDLIINAIFLLTLNNLKLCCEDIGADFPYESERVLLHGAIREQFMTETGVFTHRRGRDEICELGNSLAILAGVVTPDEARVIADEMVKNTMLTASLSMTIFKYDALITTDTEKYKDYILDEIRHNYKTMLDAGSDTVWETMGGAGESPLQAGSLCHGWSAVPVHVYRKLGMVK